MKRNFEPSDNMLAVALRDIGEEIAYPPTPALHLAVRAQIESGVVPSPLPRPRAWLRPALVAAAVVLLAVGFTLTLFPQARRAVADFIGLGGVRIEYDDEIPTVSPDELDLGPHVGLPEAEQRVAFDVKLPTLNELGLYTVHVTEPPDGGMVSLIWQEQFPGREPPDLLITQFRADLEGAFFKKLTSEGAETTFAEVRGHSGYWVKGAHAFYYFEPGEPEPLLEDVRLAANVLLWEEDGVTYRIEGDISQAEAIRIAESLR